MTESIHYQLLNEGAGGFAADPELPSSFEISPTLCSPMFDFTPSSTGSATPVFGHSNGSPLDSELATPGQQNIHDFLDMVIAPHDTNEVYHSGGLFDTAAKSPANFENAFSASFNMPAISVAPNDLLASPPFAMVAPNLPSPEPVVAVEADKGRTAKRAAAQRVAQATEDGESEYEDTEAPVIKKARGGSAQPKRKLNGVRNTTKPLISLDAPCMKKTYVTPSATSKKAVTDVARRMLATKKRGAVQLDEGGGDVNELPQEVLDAQEAKRATNRLAARLARQRKQDYIDSLEAQVQALQAELAESRNSVEEWKQRCEALQQQQQQ